LIYSTICFSQGCSDAGFCSAGNAFQGKAADTIRNTIEIGIVYADAEQDVTVLSQYVTYMRQFDLRFAMSLKVTASVANGSFGTRGNFGDAFLTGNYRFKNTDSKKWSALFGIKAPFTSANNKINGYPIPMVYQSSLGTFDLIAGLEFGYQNWTFNGALQIPVVNINRNSFISDYSGTDLFETTNLFRRKPDALLRATYDHAIGKFTFRPNVLLIYHLGEDSFENIFAQRETIDGSSGLTVNGNLISRYRIDAKNSLELSVAAPFVVRETRPDGLTRAMTIALAYQVSF
jgi:hypothetical protein